MSDRTSLNSRTAGNIIRKQVNKVLHDAGIRTSTRSGNKELKHLINRAVAIPITENSVATQLGETLGQQLVQISQEKGKSVLDKNVVLALMTQDILPSSTAPASPQEVATLSSEETVDDIAVSEEQDTVPTEAEAGLDEAVSDEAAIDDVDKSADIEPVAEEEEAETASEPVVEEEETEEDSKSVAEKKDAESDDESEDAVEVEAEVVA